MSERHPAPKSTRGHPPSLVSPPPETGGDIEGEMRPEFPGLNDLIEDDGFITVYPPIGE